jgi:hypothetical protein
LNVIQKPRPQPAGFLFGAALGCSLSKNQTANFARAGIEQPPPSKRHWRLRGLTKGSCTDLFTASVDKGISFILMKFVNGTASTVNRSFSKELQTLKRVIFGN